FVDHGHPAFLVDYNQSPQPYVSKLADTIEGLSEQHFDAIICNHVIEHVADPVAILRHLSQHLSDDGFLYVEVPMEIWRKPPLQEEPVTHINFFVAASLRRCMEEARIFPIRICLGSYLHPTGRIL